MERTEADKHLDEFVNPNWEVGHLDYPASPYPNKPRTLIPGEEVTLQDSLPQDGEDSFFNDAVGHPDWP